MLKYHEMYYLKNNKKHDEEEYLSEFIRVTKLNGKYLTHKGFDEVADISSMGIVKGLKQTWLDLLLKFHKIDNLYEYAVEEYMNYAISIGKSDSTKFVKEHPYLGQYIFSRILDIKKVRKACGFINDNYTGRYNDFLLRQHFHEVMNKLGKIPTVSEFIVNGTILPSIYCDYYGISGQLWDKVLEIMIEDKVKLENFFMERESEYKQKSISVLKEYKRQSTTPLFELEIEFRKIFDYYFNEYGTHPTRKIFNRVSKFKDITYRKRLSMRWSEVTLHYGYNIKERNVSEKIFLELLKKITGENYVRNKTWSWLLGVRNKHLYCDGYFSEIKLVVEFDGKHHRTPVTNYGGYERFLRDVQNDFVKESLVKERGYHFLRISSKEDWENVNYLTNRLKSLGLI